MLEGDGHDDGDIVVVVHIPYAGWQPEDVRQCSEVAPQNPHLEQQFPPVHTPCPGPQYVPLAFAINSAKHEQMSRN